MYQVILASGSPRRKEILEQVGIPFQIKVSQKEEKIISTNPEKTVKELALMKAQEVSKGINGESIIIGADTVVAHQNQILGKPKDEEDAFEMLQSLQGQSHFVYTGVVLIIIEKDGTEKVILFSVKTKVEVCSMTQEQIRAYIATGEPMDKAGSYGIQGRFALYIRKIEGDYYNVMGLPISAIYENLQFNHIPIEQFIN